MTINLTSTKVELTWKEVSREAIASLGRSYEELAENMGLEVDAIEAFTETMATWNEAVANGEDAEFGRIAGANSAAYAQGEGAEEAATE